MYVFICIYLHTSVTPSISIYGKVSLYIYSHVACISICLSHVGPERQRREGEETGPGRGPSSGGSLLDVSPAEGAGTTACNLTPVRGGTRPRSYRTPPSGDPRTPEGEFGSALRLALCSEQAPHTVPGPLSKVDDLHDLANAPLAVLVEPQPWKGPRGAPSLPPPPTHRGI